MRIAHFSDCYVPRINGVVTSLQVLRRAQQAQGDEVQLWVPAYPGHTQSDQGVHRFSSFPQRFQPEDRGLLPWPPARMRQLWSTPADVVHVHTPFNAGLLGWRYARHLGCPMVFTHHTLWEEYAHYLNVLPLSWARAVGRGLGDFYFRRAAAVVFPSQQIADALTGSRVSATKPWAVIPTGIDAELFAGGDGRAARQELGLDADTPLFLYVGRMGPEKSIDVLLNLFAELVRAGEKGVFALIGGGPGADGLRRQAAELGVAERVRFLGYRPRAELRNYLAAGTLFLFASQTETQGLVLLEAAAAGLPVVAVRASGVTEAVDDGVTGWLTPPGELPAMVAAVRQLLADDGKRQALGAAAERRARAFSDAAMARRMDELYRSLR